MCDDPLAKFNLNSAFSPNRLLRPAGTLPVQPGHSLRNFCIKRFIEFVGRKFFVIRRQTQKMCALDSLRRTENSSRSTLYSVQEVGTFLRTTFRSGVSTILLTDALFSHLGVIQINKQFSNVDLYYIILLKNKETYQTKWLTIIVKIKAASLKESNFKIITPNSMQYIRTKLF